MITPGGAGVLAGPPARMSAVIELPRVFPYDITWGGTLGTGGGTPGPNSVLTFTSGSNTIESGGTLFGTYSGGATPTVSGSFTMNSDSAIRSVFVTSLLQLRAPPPPTTLYTLTAEVQSGGVIHIASPATIGPFSLLRSDIRFAVDQSAAVLEPDMF